MELIELRVLRGPNYWSNYRKKLIELTIDLKEYEQKPTNLITNFYANLKKLMPSLNEHFCSENKPGGFFSRVKKGTWLGHVIEHVALELQWLAGMHCGFGRTRSSSKFGIYYVIFSYEYEDAGVLAGRTAFKIIEYLAHQHDYVNLNNDIKALKKIYKRQKFGPTTESIMQEIIRRKIPWDRLDKDSLIMVGQGKNQKLIMASSTSDTSEIALEIASDKDLTKTILKNNHIPVPNAPNKGEGPNFASAVVDMLYPEGTPSRIPIVAVTGTNGKTTVVRLIAYLAQTNGYTVGFTTTDGIYIDQKQIYQGDCSGPKSAREVLSEPLVDFAVFECARGGILREGLAFDFCNISIVTNITEDHLGQDGIYTLADLQRTKMVVPRSTLKDGFAILNADDPLVLEIKEDLECNIALFALEKTRVIEDHINHDGIASYYKDDYLIIESKKHFSKILNVAEVAITHFGQLNLMRKNILPAVLAAYLVDIKPALIETSLKSLSLTSNCFPGRMNLFTYDKGFIFIDYAHNPGAFIALKSFVQSIPSSFKKICIISATGDRRDIDIINLGKLVSEIFDDIIIKHDEDGRGRSNQELTDLLMAGITSTHKKNDIKIISNEFAAIKYSIDHSKKNTFIFYFPEKVDYAIELVHSLIDKKQGEVAKEKVTININT